MTENYFSDQRRVRAILLTKRRTIVLIKRPSDKPDQEAYYVAPGGVVHDDDPDEEIALKHEVGAQLGAEVKVVRQAMSLFMAQWTFYICELLAVNADLRSDESTEALRNGDYQIVEIKLTEATLRAIHLQPRALLDYLLAHMDELYK